MQQDLSIAVGLSELSRLIRLDLPGRFSGQQSDKLKNVILFPYKKWRNN